MVSHPILLPINSILSAFDYVRTFRGLEWICGGGFRGQIFFFSSNLITHFQRLSVYSIAWRPSLLQTPIRTALTTSIKLSLLTISARKTRKHIVFNQQNRFRSIERTDECLNDAYGATCGNIVSSDVFSSSLNYLIQGGHFGCESFRFIFDHACPGLKCNIRN
uniref:Uncharacterized protein n=1 Tax=Caenorhabditis tropicalis TaxID=1561998 RepID=A0A1I7U649_9PELO